MNQHLMRASEGRSMRTIWPGPERRVRSYDERVSRLAACCVALVAACSVKDFSLAGKACPCPEGYFCDTATNRCAAGVAPAPTVASDAGLDQDTGPNPLVACEDGVKDGDEADVDCGGSCPRCPGAACASDGECATGSCIGQTCELATSPPGWIAVASLPAPRFGLGAASSTDGRVLAVDGFENGSQNNGWAYRPIPPPLGAWEPLPALAIARRGVVAVTASDGAVLVLGGKSEADAGGVWFANVEKLAPGASGWVAGPSMNAARYKAAAALGADGRIYAGGGSSDTAPALATVEQLGPADSAWSGVAPMLQGRYGGAAVSFGGSIYVCGGFDGATALSECEAYSPTENRWRVVAPLTAPRMSIAGALGADQRIYAMGGAADDQGTPAFDTVEAFVPPSDPATSPGRWTHAASLPKAATQLAATTGADGCVYAIGGIQYGGGMTNLTDVVAYCPRITLTPASGPAGTRASLSGTNFGATARVQVFVANQSSPVAVTNTDARGAIAAPATFAVPASCGTPCVVTVIDHRSRYPVRAEFVVTP
jgi:hypothetical protein